MAWIAATIQQKSKCPSRRWEGQELVPHCDWPIIKLGLIWFGIMLTIAAFIWSRIQ